MAKALGEAKADLVAQGWGRALPSLAACVTLFCSTALWAEAPKSSIRPAPRAEAAAVVTLQRPALRPAAAASLAPLPQLTLPALPPGPVAAGLVEVPHGPRAEGPVPPQPPAMVSVPPVPSAQAAELPLPQLAATTRSADALVTAVAGASAVLGDVAGPALLPQAASRDADVAKVDRAGVTDIGAPAAVPGTSVLAGAGPAKAAAADASTTAIAVQPSAAEKGPAQASVAQSASAEPSAKTSTRLADVPAGWEGVEGNDLRPKPRSKTLRFGEAASVQASLVSPMGAHLTNLLRPLPRPNSVVRQAQAAAQRAPIRQLQPDAQIQNVAAVRPAPTTPRLSSPRGSVCGIAGLKGEILSPIVARVQGCGIANPVRITEVDGIRLSQPATIDCETARAFHSWVRTGLQPAMGNTGGGITQIQIAGHYVCRTRNHRKGAKVSEHGRGRALDISGLVLASGQKLSILRDWRGAHGAKLKAAHRAACGTFGTTLGPGSDGMHEDHLHFDTAKHRSGSYCR